MRKLLVLVMVAVVGVPLFLGGAFVAFAGPFGTIMGQPASDFPDKVGSNNYDFLVNKMPKLHSLFNKFILSIHPNIGLSQIIAISHDFDNDRYGNSAMEAFSKLKDQLSDVYGVPKCDSYLVPGSIWKKDGEWVSAIKNNERVQQCVWDTPNREDNIVRLHIKIVASSSSSCYIGLCYKYKNHSEFESKVNESSKEAL